MLVVEVEWRRAIAVIRRGSNFKEDGRIGVCGRGLKFQIMIEPDIIAPMDRASIGLAIKFSVSDDIDEGEERRVGVKYTNLVSRME